MLLIPKKEALDDVHYYKEELTGNAWLNRAGELAAAKKRILEDPRLTPQEIVQRVQPLSHQLFKTNKRLRQIPPVSAGGRGGGGEEGEDDEPDDDGSDLVSTGLEKWLKRLAKGIQTPMTTKTPTTPRTVPRPRPTPRPRSSRGTPLTTLGTPSTSSGRPPPRRLAPSLPAEEEEVTPPPKKKTLSMSIVEGALKGLTGEKAKQKAKRYTPPKTRSKTRGINTSQWLPFH